jgi:DNA-binding NtrC family response regulator
MALTAKEGIRANADHAPHILLIDICLNEGDKAGLDLVEELLTDNPPARAIMLSGSTHMQDAVQAVKMGAADFLEKPIDFERLYKLVEQNSN